jgi:hypothetical protein
LYSQPKSLLPAQVGCGENEKYLYGIFKTSVELIHTIIEAISHLAVTFLDAKSPNSVRVFTTGHSLGGALCSNFAYLWVGIKQTAKYKEARYNIISDNIICISVGAPRCMGTLVANTFCKFVKEGKILFLRITTRGDPVPGLPAIKYYHPCSIDDAMRQTISEDCNANLTARTGKISVNYEAALDCQNYKTRTYVPNPLSHTVYLNILFTNAVDIVNFLKGVGVAKEVKRTPKGNTVCRIIQGTNSSPSGYNIGFFDVSLARDNPPSITIGGADTHVNESGPIKEDVYMSFEAFKILITQLKPINNQDLCPMDWDPSQLINPFTDKIKMPILSCVNVKSNAEANPNPNNKSVPSVGGKSKFKTRRNKRHDKTKTRRRKLIRKKTKRKQI